MRSVGSRARGQTGTEYMLVISVIVIAVVGAAYVFVPKFEEGVNELGRDVRQVLALGDIGGIGHDGGSNANGGVPKLEDTALPAGGPLADPSTVSGGLGAPASGIANGGSGGD